ncbi:unnamed protein product [Larinioides sclopetarius]|uniref:Uncharacterized protein n=1 Tax=Larinioides sclopetarius TaxID=280406 RepID=A0AAV1ZEH2_9ARAC
MKQRAVPDRSQLTRPVK